MRDNLKKEFNKLVIYQDQFETPPSSTFYRRVMMFYLDGFKYIEKQLSPREQNFLQYANECWLNNAITKLDSLRQVYPFDSKIEAIDNMFLHIIDPYDAYMRNYKYNQFELFELFIDDLYNLNIDDNKIATLLNKHFSTEIECARGIQVYKNKPDDWELSIESCEYYRFTSDTDDEIIYIAFGVPYRYIGRNNYPKTVINDAKEFLTLLSPLDADVDYIEFKKRLEENNNSEVWIEFV